MEKMSYGSKIEKGRSEYARNEEENKERGVECRKERKREGKKEERKGR